MWYVFIGSLAFVLLLGTIYIILDIADKSDDFARLLFYFLKTREYKELKPCITFTQFFSFYELNPLQWELYYESVVYAKTRQTFYFSTYGDIYKYRKWRDAISKRAATTKAMQELNTAINGLTNGIKEDVAAMQARVERELNTVQRETTHIQKRLEK